MPIDITNDDHTDPSALDRPFTAVEQAEDYLISYWTLDKLKKHTQTEDLDSVVKIEIKVDSRKTGLGDLGRHFINLEQLKLNNSHVPLLRDLGSGFENLVVLWMARCSISDLDGIGSFSKLREVYLAFNDIKDISDLSRLEYLEILDLESNEIPDIGQIEYLALCPALADVCLQGNPFLDLVHEEDAILSGKDEKAVNQQRQLILQILPNLSLLDDIPVGIDTTQDEAAMDVVVVAEGFTKINDQHSLRPSSALGHNQITNSTVSGGGELHHLPARPASSFAIRTSTADETFGFTPAVNPVIRGGRRRVMMKGAHQEQTPKPPNFLPPLVTGGLSTGNNSTTTLALMTAPSSIYNYLTPKPPIPKPPSSVPPPTHLRQSISTGNPRSKRFTLSQQEVPMKISSRTSSSSSVILLGSIKERSPLIAPTPPPIIHKTSIDV